MATPNIVNLPHAAKPAREPAEARPSSTRRKLALASATAIGAVAIAATALSLSDLADSIEAVAHTAIWKSYALAAALDCNFVATEAFSLLCTAAVARETRCATLATKVITLGMSGIANAFALASHADGVMLQAACVLAGFAIPGLIALSTFTLGQAVRS
jgi:hypothetical protein